VLHLLGERANLGGVDFQLFILEQTGRRTVVPFVGGHRLGRGANLVFLVSPLPRESCSRRLLATHLGGGRRPVLLRLSFGAPTRLAPQGRSQRAARVGTDRHRKSKCHHRNR
jgi:hypothetical protein